MLNPKSPMAGPLTHIKVLDLSRVLAGPWCGQLLADMGAEVIKIERPADADGSGGGDDTRTWGPPYLKDATGNDTSEAAYFLSANRGKQSVTLDISKPEGQEVVRRLAQRCATEGLGRLEWAVLDWNAPSIAFYDSLGATAKTEWITRRLSGQALENLAQLGA